MGVSFAGAAILALAAASSAEAARGGRSRRGAPTRSKRTQSRSTPSGTKGTFKFTSSAECSVEAKASKGKKAKNGLIDMAISAEQIACNGDMKDFAKDLTDKAFAYAEAYADVVVNCKASGGNTNVCAWGSANAYEEASATWDIFIEAYASSEPYCGCVGAEVFADAVATIEVWGDLLATAYAEAEAVVCFKGAGELTATAQSSCFAMIVADLWASLYADAWAGVAGGITAGKNSVCFPGDANGCDIKCNEENVDPHAPHDEGCWNRCMSGAWVDAKAKARAEASVSIKEKKKECIENTSLTDGDGKDVEDKDNGGLPPGKDKDGEKGTESGGKTDGNANTDGLDGDTNGKIIAECVTIAQADIRAMAQNVFLPIYVDVVEEICEGKLDFYASQPDGSSPTPGQLGTYEKISTAGKAVAELWVELTRRCYIENNQAYVDEYGEEVLAAAACGFADAYAETFAEACIAGFAQASASGKSGNLAEYCNCDAGAEAEGIISAAIKQNLKAFVFTSAQIGNDEYCVYDNGYTNDKAKIHCKANVASAVVVRAAASGLIAAECYVKDPTVCEEECAAEHDPEHDVECDVDGCAKASVTISALATSEITANSYCTEPTLTGDAVLWSDDGVDVVCLKGCE